MIHYSGDTKTRLRYEKVDERKDRQYQQDRVKQAWGDWIGAAADWSWFVTINPRDFGVLRGVPGSSVWVKDWQFEKMRKDRFPGWENYGRESIIKIWLDFIKQVKFDIPDPSALRWVATIERGKHRKTSHLHGLVDADYLNRKEVGVHLWEKWGMNRLVEYVPDKGAAHYITKYICKDPDNEILFSRRLRNELSKNGPG